MSLHVYMRISLAVKYSCARVKLRGGETEREGEVEGMGGLVVLPHLLLL